MSIELDEQVDNILDDELEQLDNSTEQFDNTNIKEQLNKLKSMPKHELQKLLQQYTNLYNTENSATNSSMSTKDRLKAKLDMLKFKRISKNAQEHIKDTQEINNSIPKKTEEEPKPLSKSQKKRLAKHRKKLDN